VWLLGALLVSWVERDYMDRLGWDVWPSGLALGPQGWLQILVFLTFAAAMIVFAFAVRALALPRLGRWGSRVLLVAALITPLLAFRTDPPGDPMTWHGALHATGYVVLMLGLLASYALLLPGILRRARGRQWGWAALALLLVPPGFLMPTSTGTSGYLFFAVPFVPLAAAALMLITRIAQVD
jgi:hypothetical protein